MENSVLCADEVLELLRRPDAVGMLVGDPVIAISVEASAAFEEVVDLLLGLPSVAVGVASSTGECSPLDVVVTSPDELELVRRAVDRSPQAAVALVQLLRLGDHLDLQSAVVAESLVYGLLQSGPEFRAWLRAQPVRQHLDVAAPVRLERNHDLLRITLNRPQVQNAFDAPSRDGVIEGCTLAVIDPGITRVELHGEGRNFCAGGDLSEFGTTPNPVVGHLVRTTRSAARAVAGCADKLSAFLHGACIGAGIELPAFAARVVATRDTAISLPEMAMGLVPGAGGTASIPRRIGRQRTAWLALTGSQIDADTALDWGLVDEIVD